MGLGPPGGYPESTAGAPSSAARHPHPALGAIEGAGAAGLVPAMRTGQAGTATDRGKARLLGLAEAVAGGDHLLVQGAQQLVADALRVATKAFAAPAHHGSDDELTRQLIPMRGAAADDGVVLGIAAGIDLAVQEAAAEGVYRHVARIGHLEDVQPVAADGADVATGENPLLDLVEALDGGRRIGVLQRQRLDALDGRLAQGLHDARNGSRDRWIRPEAQPIAAARDERDAEAVLLRGDLLLHGSRRWRRGCLLLASEEGHVRAEAPFCLAARRFYQPTRRGPPWPLRVTPPVRHNAQTARE